MRDGGSEELDDDARDLGEGSCVSDVLVPFLVVFVS
jgi:hypothetical protein